MFDSAHFGGDYHVGPHDVAVVIPTVVRPQLLRAVESVYRQEDCGRIQILVGINKAPEDLSLLQRLKNTCPAHCSLFIFNPGYSTSVRHGGVHSAQDGGSLRTVLSFHANSQYVAYLDDDNWWAPEHLATLLTACKAGDWAYSLRWLVDETTLQNLCVDQWHSLGPGKRVLGKNLAGFVDPNALMVDKIKCAEVLHLWSVGGATYSSADRRISHALCQKFKGVASGKATAHYTIRPTNKLWQHAERYRGSAPLPA